MTSTIGLLDQDSRQRAINPEGSYAVSAPAGSGKTELLIQRTLSLLTRVQAPEEILAITFTRKAANEMRERILQALVAAKQASPCETRHEQQTRDLANRVLDQDQEMGWSLLDNPGRIGIQTIDGFCLKLANQLCLETGITVPPLMSEDSDALYRQAAERILDFMDAQGPVGDALRRLVSHLDGHLDKLCSLIAQLLASRDSWLPIVVPGHIDESYLQEKVSALIEETLTQAMDALMPYSSELEGFMDYAYKHREGASYLHKDFCNSFPEPVPEHLSQWKALRGFLLTKKDGVAKFRAERGLEKRLGFPTESEFADKHEAKARKKAFAALLEELNHQPNLLETLDHIDSLPDEDVSHASPLNTALFTLLPVAAAEFNTLSQENAETDFTAVTMAAIQALGDKDNPTPLALRLDYKIQHILVDEFQDTSAIQVDLLERLTAGWTQGDGRSLFIVGDGMQSIYAFRKANVGLFIRARRFGIGDTPLQPLDLSANFRSDAQIVDWVNQTFAQVFPAEDRLSQGQVAFTQAQATRPTQNCPVQLSGHSSTEVEAETIADDIASRIADGEEGIAILVRGRPHLKSILPSLRSRGIQWQAQDIDPLASRMAVMDLHSLTRALCVPADRIAWLSILRAPWAGLSQADLLSLSHWSPEGRIQITLWSAIQSCEQIVGLSSDGLRSCRRLTECFKRAFEQLGKINLRANIEQLWNGLDGSGGLLEERDFKDIKDYLDLLETQESGGMIKDWVVFDRKLNKLYSRPAVEAEKAAKVKIMTIHGAKGLDFNHVYIPALERAQSSNEDPLLLWWLREYEDGSEGYLLAAKPDGKTDDVKTLYSYLKAQEAERSRQETARLLYVAATRARQSLHLSAVLKWDDKKEKVSKPLKGSMLSVLWELYEEQFCSNYQPPVEPEEKEVAVLEGIRRLPTFRDLPVYEETEPQALKSNNSKYSQNYMARICGDLIHQSLMRIVRERITEPGIGIFQNDWQRGLAVSGLSADGQKQALERLSSMLTAINQDKQARWILDFNHQESAAELEMDYLDANGSIQLAIIDRTFIENGTRWIIDYKSSSPHEGQSLDEFLQSEADEYSGQLKRYAALFEGKPRAMLYFPSVPASIEISGL